METSNSNPELTGIEKFILGKRLAGLLLAQGPKIAIDTLHSDRQVWYEASSHDRLNDLGGILTAFPYGIRSAILRSRI